MEVSEKRIEEIIHSYQPDRRYALAIMQDMQREFQYVPREGMEALAEELQCPVSSLYAMATFYKALSLVPKGKHIIKCCDGTACHIRGASTLIDGIRRELKIGPGETTQDLVVDDVYYGKVTLEKLKEIIQGVKEGGAE